MTECPVSVRHCWIIIATSASSSTSSTRRPAAILACPEPLAARSRAGCGSGRLIGSAWGIESVHCSPRGSQSNVTLPPSCCSTLARITFRPKLRVAGGAIRGPPLSIHSSTRSSGRSCQVRLTLPAIDDSAPCLAALVASSCSAKPRPCAICGSSETFGPPTSTLSASRDPIGRQFLADQRARGRRPASAIPTAARARAPSALMRPSTAAM